MSTSTIFINETSWDSRGKVWKGGSILVKYEGMGRVAVLVQTDKRLHSVHGNLNDTPEDLIPRIEPAFGDDEGFDRSKRVKLIKAIADGLDHCRAEVQHYCMEHSWLLPISASDARNIQRTRRTPTPTNLIHYALAATTLKVQRAIYDDLTVALLGPEEVPTEQVQDVIEHLTAKGFNARLVSGGIRVTW